MSKLSKSKKTTAAPRPGNCDKNGNFRSVLGHKMASRNYVCRFNDVIKTGEKLASDSIKVTGRLPKNIKDVTSLRKFDSLVTVRVSDSAGSEIDRCQDEFERLLANSEDENDKLILSLGQVSQNYGTLNFLARLISPLTPGVPPCCGARGPWRNIPAQHTAFERPCLFVSPPLLCSCRPRPTCPTLSLPALPAHPQG